MAEKEVRISELCHFGLFSIESSCEKSDTNTFYYSSGPCPGTSRSPVIHRPFFYLTAPP